MKLIAVLTVCFLSYGSITSVAQTYRPFAITRDGGSSSIFYGSTCEEIEPIETTVIDRTEEKPRILPATLDADDLDSLLLQRLYKQFQSRPELFKKATNFSDVQINSLNDKLTIFRQIVLNEQTYALDEMCAVWNYSSLDLEAKIDDTLAAFDYRIDAGKPEVARAVQDVLSSMELEANPEQKLKFYESLNVSRKKLMASKAFTFSQNVRIIGDTEATLKYHCEEVR